MVDDGVGSSTAGIFDYGQSGANDRHFQLRLGKHLSEYYLFDFH